MKTCPGCGAFYNYKCDYCGYIGTKDDKETYNKFVNLHIKGSMNHVNVKYGEQKRDNIIISGSMQHSEICAKFINIEIKGSMNHVSVDKNVEYVPLISGSMNHLSQKRGLF